jgi:magnesium chelatase subunit I
MKLAIPIAAIDTTIGGVLVFGDRGTGKSTAVRAVAALLPVVDLPLGATEDRVVGALDLERALFQGAKAFEPGLFAVNLLEEHLVDLLIDVAASGENVLEREGLSIRHPARFVLVGTGNPAEGELRPQLLDRFGLSVKVKTPDDLTLIRAVRALAALKGDAEITDAHLRRVAAPALRHRQRRDPLDDAGSSVRVDRAVTELMGA